MKPKSAIGVMGCFMLLIVLCVAGYATIMTILSVATAMQLPFGKQQALAWILGVPQPTGSWGGEGSGVSGGISVGSKVYKGVVLDPSFACIIPIEDGKVGVSDPYGSPRPGYMNHPGIDIGTYGVQGYDVRTPWGGEVVFMGSYGPWGPTVIIENMGVQVVLSHASGFPPNLSVGDVVQAKDVVMYSGGCVDAIWTKDSVSCPYDKNGSSTGPHLHFEVRDVSKLEPGQTGGAVQAVNPSTFVWPDGSTCDFETLIRTKGPKQ